LNLENCVSPKSYRQLATADEEGGVMEQVSEEHTNLLVHPVNNIFVTNQLCRAAATLGEYAKRVGAHQLPDKAECECTIAIVDVLALNPDEGEPHLFAQLDSIVTIADLIHHGGHFFELFHNTLMINHTRFDDIV
jgi:hypothetical protein